MGSQESKRLLDKHHLTKIKFIKTDNLNQNSNLSVINLFIHTFRRTFLGIYKIIQNYQLIRSFSYCYTISDFYPDFVIGFIYKIFNPKGIWISGHYLFVPKPTEKNSPYQAEKIKGWLYYLSQQLTQYIANTFADIIYVTSKPDTSHFPNKKVVVIQGGVNTKIGNNYLISKKQILKIYDGLFFGRLHPQKGVLELIDIWKLLCQKIPQAKLAIIGDGMLLNQLKSKIIKNNLSQNITLFGFQTGKQKYKIIKQSKIILHPAIYDSGGMAAAEAMSFGLPGVSFNLPALKSYYPQGMVKTPTFDKQAFADNIYLLLTDSHYYKQTSKQAINLINRHWDWGKQALDIYEKTFN